MGFLNVQSISSHTAASNEVTSCPLTWPRTFHFPIWSQSWVDDPKPTSFGSSGCNVWLCTSLILIEGFIFSLKKYSLIRSRIPAGYYSVVGAKHSQVMIFPPPCFTAGIQFFSWNAVFIFHQKCSLFCTSAYLSKEQHHRSVGFHLWSHSQKHNVQNDDALTIPL